MPRPEECIARRFVPYKERLDPSDGGGRGYTRLANSTREEAPSAAGEKTLKVCRFPREDA